MIRFIDYPNNYKVRAFGWIQDASDFENLHCFVSLFSKKSYYKEELNSKINTVVIEEKRDYFFSILNASLIKIKYSDIVGTSPKGSRKSNTVCNGLGQASLKGQKKERDFQGDWPTDNFLRWAEALQFIKYDYSDDTFSITNEGECFSQESDAEKQKDLIEKQLSYYPPALRVLELLKEGELSKFGIGHRLGFIGEKGFTFVTEELYAKTYATNSSSVERSAIRANLEGSSDKYARQICSWLFKLNLIDKVRKSLTIENEVVSLPSAYKINAKGENFLRKYLKSSKYVPFGMLSMESTNKELHKKRRALILKLLSEGDKDLLELTKLIEDKEVITYEQEIMDDLKSLSNMGLCINKQGNKFKLVNPILGLDIPNKIELDTTKKALLVKEILRKNLNHIDHDLLNLIDYSLSKRSSRMFEVYVTKAFTVLSNQTYLFGGPYKPDVISIINNLLIIIDAKAYKNGFNMQQSEQDKMVRYANDLKENPKGYDWINKLKENHSFDDIGFNFTSSGFGINISNKVKDLADRMGLAGSCINVIELLYMIDEYQCNSIDLIPYFNSNKEIILSDNSLSII